MGFPPGHSVPLSPLRRLMCDLLTASRRVPLVAVERTMPLGEVIAARREAAVRPSWFAIFIKAYAVVSADRPELRRAYLSFPWPRLHQHAGNVAALAVARQVNGEDGVLTYQIRHPEQLTLGGIDDLIRSARTDPVERSGSFRRQLRVARFPWPVRRLAWWLGLEVLGNYRAKWFGTFGVTGVAALGSASLSLLSPLTSTLTFGVFRPDGSVTVRLFYDHRVFDGIEPAAALEALEKTLLGPVRAELVGMAGSRPGSGVTASGRSTAGQEPGDRGLGLGPTQCGVE